MRSGISDGDEQTPSAMDPESRSHAEHRRRLMERPFRQKLSQDSFPFALNVGITPILVRQAVQQATVDSLHTTIMSPRRSTAANPVFVGRQNIDITKFNGMEILPGTPIALKINIDRELYELHGSVLD